MTLSLVHNACEIGIREDRPRFSRTFNDIDVDQLLTPAGEPNWNNIYEMTSVVHSNNCITHLFDRFAPLRQVRTRIKSNAMWFGSSIRRAILMLDVAFRRWRNSRTDIFHEQYCSLRNSVT